MKRKHFFFLLFVLCLSRYVAFSQDAKINWIANPGQEKVFIENKGQFPVTNRNVVRSADVLYAYDDGPVMVYFCKTGITYTFNKKLLKNKHEEHHRGRNELESREKEEKERKISTISDIIQMNWLNTSPNMEVIPYGEKSFHFSYAIRSGKNMKNLNFLRAYEKLLYKNIYNGIDVEFVFHPDEGLKYSLILHPGADVRNFKMKFSGDKKIMLNNSGDLHIPTKFGDIIDFAPYAYYQDDNSQKIIARFSRLDNIISFNLGNYDHGKTVIIDPWTVNPAIPASRRVWAVDKDDAGNAYIYGGDMPMTLKKYNSSGTLQWSYSSPWDSTGYWVGTMCTDRAGNAYITSGSNGEISKINTSGSLVWHNNPNGLLGPLFEYWDLAFNCDETQLIVGGMRGANAMGVASYRGVMLNINLTSGAVNGYAVVGHVQGMNIKEVRSMTGAPDRNFYYLTLDSIGCIDPSLNILWQSNSTYDFSYGNPEYQLNGNLGIRAIRVNDSYIYTSRANRVDRRSIANGAILNSANIPGGIYNAVPLLGHYTVGNSGLELDSCGNVYVGSGSGIYKFDANLNQVSNVATPSAVYDVAVTRSGEVLACGNNYVMSVNMSACQPYRMRCCPTINIDFNNIVHVDCAGNLGHFDATPVGATPPYNYNLQNSGGSTVANYSNVNGTQNFSGLTADTYTLVITDANNCTSSSIIEITQPAGIPTPVIAGPTQICTGNSALLDAGAGYDSYLWSTGSPNQSINVTAGGTYSVTVTNSSGCSGTANITLTVVPSLTVTVTANPQTVCPGTPSLLTASGGTSYVWETGEQTPTATVTPFNTTTYSVTATDDNGCSGVGNVTVNVDSVLQVNASGTNTNCGQSDGTASVNVPAGNYTFIWSTTPPQTTQTATNLGVGNYSVTVTNNGCHGVATVSIAQEPGPEASFFASPTTITIGTGSVSFSDRSTGNVAVSLWYFGDDAFESGFNASHEYSDTGRYLVTHIVIDSGGCVDTAYGYIHVIPDFNFYIPNSFSPNNDHINDVFLPQGNGVDPSTYTMAIYNRWGQRMFETDDLSEGWNGTYKNQDHFEKAVEGVYVYIIQLSDLNGRKFKYLGSVTLIQ